MIGAIVGDIVGSIYEYKNIKTKDFPLFQPYCEATDDSVMPLAIGQAILETREYPDMLGSQAVQCMVRLGNRYPNAGYGGSFMKWLRKARYTKTPKPYNSYGNGGAMRVSPCGFAAASLEEALKMARTVTEVTHNHPEGMKGAEATAAAVFLARTGKSKQEIRDYITGHYYDLSFTLDEIRPVYRYDVSAQGTVPQALVAFLEGESFEDAIRNAISIGGDSDTVAAVTGGVAEAYWGVPEDIRAQAEQFLDPHQRSLVHAFEKVFPGK